MGKELTIIIIPEAELSVDEAVRSYFFNSQIITRPDGAMAMIAPMEVQDRKSGSAAGADSRRWD